MFWCRLNYVTNQTSNYSLRSAFTFCSRIEGHGAYKVDDEYVQWMKETSWWRNAASPPVVGGRKQELKVRTQRVLLEELRACSSAKNLQRGKEIHADAIQSGNISCIYVATALINMYGKCGSMHLALQVFDGIKHPDVVSWTAFILGYAENGQGVTALNLFARMKSEGCTPNCITFVAALKACKSLAVTQDEGGKSTCLERGRQVHSEIGCRLNVHLQSTLIDMYSSCGSMVDARIVFEGIHKPDVVAWNALILGYAENGEACTSLDLFHDMKSQGFAPNSATYVAVLKACTFLALRTNGARKAELLELVEQIRSDAGCHLDTYVQNTLVDMYSKCGNMPEARQVFDAIQHPSLVSWNALMFGYAENGDGEIALELFKTMKSRGLTPNSVSFIAALKACTRTECLERGKEIHVEIGCHGDTFVQNTLIDMYAKCGSMSDACGVFYSMKKPSVVSWNALMFGYAEGGDGIAALDLFAKMRSKGCAPDSVTFVAAIKACTTLALNQNGSRNLEYLERGRRIHLEAGCGPDAYVSNALIEMYAKFGVMADAHQVFDCMEQPDVISWTTLILGYAESEEGGKALDLFRRMRSQGCAPSSYTLVAALKACSVLGALDCGRHIHAEMNTGRIEMDAFLLTSLVDFYAKCGSLAEAQQVFDSYPRSRSLRTWTALLAGYSRLGDSRVVFRLFRGMQDAGLEPDGVTFLCILKCCSHAGTVDKARESFEAMYTKYWISPNVQHYTCMVDILGRSNNLTDAIVLLQSMPCAPDAVSWMTLLSACRKWRNVEIGRMAFKTLLCLDDTSGSAYVLMAQIYGTKGMWEEHETVLALRKRFKARKEPGRSCWTSQVGEVHTFLVG